MFCTYCHAQTTVTNSRIQRRNNSIWRRRRCLNCGKTVSTIEQLDYERSWSVAYPALSDKPFLRDKLLISIAASLQHRQDATSEAVGLCATVMHILHSLDHSQALPVEAIAAATLQTLERFDKAAATYYKAFHPTSLAQH